MLIYILNLVFIAGVYRVGSFLKISNEKILRVSLLYLFCISSFRDQTMGADYLNYISAFYTIAQRGNYYMEHGYVFINKIVLLFTHNYIGIAIAVNLIIFISLYFLIRKCVSDSYWGLIVYIFAANPYMFIQTTFNAMRQGCAEGLILIGMIVLYENKNKIFSVFIFVMMTILAAQIHKISYACLFIPIIFMINWDKKKWLVVFIVSIIGNIVGFDRIIEVVINQLHFGESYLNYTDSMLNNPIYIILICVFFFYLLYHYDDFAVLDSKNVRILNFYLFSICFLIIALRNDMVYRVYMIISLCALPGVAVICENIDVSSKLIRFKKERTLIKILYVMYYTAFYLGYMGRFALRGNTNYVPFKFYFQN